jgi:AraC-like DNA-binding protein
MDFSGRFTLNIIQFAAKQGADWQKLIALTGKSLEELSKEDCRISPEIYNRVAVAAVEQSQNPVIGLQMGESLNLNALGLMGHIVQSSPTVKQALENACEFAKLGCQALPMQLIEEKEHYKLILTPHPLWAENSEEAVRQTADATITFTVREFQTLTLQKYYPKALYLKYKAPKVISEYERLFQCPVHFNQNEYAILFEKAHIEQPVVTSDFNLLRILVQHAEQKLSELNREAGFKSLVKQSVLNLIKPDFPTIEQVAGSLNLSVRSLQRKLKEEEINFKQIIEELKKQFAENYLKREELSISEIAYMLDYAEPSAFIRSFKRWTGMTPQVFREKNLKIIL